MVGAEIYSLLEIEASSFNDHSRSGLVVKFVLAMHEPRVRFTAATFVLSFVDPNATRHCFIVLPGSVRLGKGHLVFDFDRSLG